MLAGSIEGLIAIIDLNQGTTIRIINDHRSTPISSLESIYSNATQLTYWLAASCDKHVSIWSSKSNDDLFQIIDRVTFQSEQFSKELRSSYKSAKNFFREKNPKVIVFFVPQAGHENDTKNPDTIFGNFGNDPKKQILFYNFVKKQIIRTMEITEVPECICISPRSNLIAFGTKSRLLQLKDYNRATFQDYAQHSDSISSVCFSNDGKRLFSTAFNEILIWEVVI